jgi:hypothetical protein
MNNAEWRKKSPEDANSYLKDKSIQAIAKPIFV